MQYSYQGCSLTLNGKTINFLSQIEKVIEISNTLIVMLKGISTELKNKENKDIKILEFDDSGRNLWRIQKCPHGGDREKPYMGIEMKEGKVIVHNWIGVDYEVNLKNGAVKPYGSGKRPW